MTAATAATTKIATCYNPSAAPGARTLIVIACENTSGTHAAGRYLITKILGGNVDGIWRRKTEELAFEHAADLGYTEVLRETRVDRAAIENLRGVANLHGLIAFTHLCQAAMNALDGTHPSEAWALNRIEGTLARVGVMAQAALRVANFADMEAITVDAIRDTDTTRPDGAIARGAVIP